MWRSKRTKGLLDSLNKCKHVDEIIIIDNNKEKCPDLSKFSKVVYVPQSENIYVNPAWNLGVSKSRNDYVCLINDDITLEVDLFFDACFNSNKPAIGMNKKSWSCETVKSISIDQGHHLGHGWGCCIFLEKKYWVDIPDQMKIWRGDVWICKNYPSVHSILIKARTEMGTTSKAQEMSKIKKNDLKYWDENISNK